MEDFSNRRLAVKRIIPILAYLVCVLFVATSGMATSSLFDTGDKDLDGNLERLNLEAKADLEDFSQNISAQFDVERANIDAAMRIDKMEPAEVYIALELALISGKPLETVIIIHKDNMGKGWGVVAQALGIKPGSEDFKQLKASVSKKSEKSVSKKSDKKEQKTSVEANKGNNTSKEKGNNKVKK